MKSDKRPNNNLSIKQILDYLRGYLVNQDKNRLERDAISDPFNSDAFDGLSQLTAQELENDLKELSDQLYPQKKIRVLPIITKVTAIALMLIVPSIAIWYLIRFEPQKQTIGQAMEEKSDTIILKEHKTLEESKELPQKKESTPPTPKKLVPQQATATVKQNTVVDDISLLNESEYSYAEFEDSDAEQAATDIQPSEDLLLKGTLSDENGKPLTLAAVRIKDTNIGTITNDKGEFELKAKSEKSVQLEASHLGFQTKEITTENDSSLNIAMESKNYDLDGVTIESKAKRGSGTMSIARRDLASATSKVKKFRLLTIKRSPRPANGMAKYKKYLKENIQTPDNPTGKREKVIVEVSIGIYGEIIDITPLESPNESYSDCVIDAIEEGSDWIPGTINKRKIASKRKIKVIFKRE